MMLRQRGTAGAKKGKFFVEQIVSFNNTWVWPKKVYRHRGVAYMGFRHTYRVWSNVHLEENNSLLGAG